MNRVGQVWENAAGLIVLVTSSSEDGRSHRLLVLSEGHVETGLKPGDPHTWESTGRPDDWETGPSRRIA